MTMRHPSAPQVGFLGIHIGIRSAGAEANPSFGLG
jgi:hypothetical protein